MIDAVEREALVQRFDRGRNAQFADDNYHSRALNAYSAVANAEQNSELANLLGIDEFA